MTIEQTWIRNGEEVQAEDWAEGYRVPIDAQYIRPVLARILSDDLDALSNADERENALASAVDGYVDSRAAALRAEQEPSTVIDDTPSAVLRAADEVVRRAWMRLPGCGGTNMSKAEVESAIDTWVAALRERGAIEGAVSARAKS